jgi:hypothetical protein
MEGKKWHQVMVSHMQHLSRYIHAQLAYAFRRTGTGVYLEGAHTPP